MPTIAELMQTAEQSQGPRDRVRMDTGGGEQMIELARLARLLRGAINGQSGGIFENEFGVLERRPDMIGGRLGVELDGARAGINAGVANIPGVGRQMMPPRLDLGYALPAAGGKIDFGGSVDAKGDKGAMVRFLRNF